MDVALPIRAVCVGAGYFIRFHFEAWRRIENADLVGAVDPDLKRARATGVDPYDNLSSAIVAKSPDLADIVTPPQTHLPLIREAIGQGIRTIVCQKLFCRDLQEARQAVELAVQASVRLVAHENFRFQPWYRVIRQQIDAGRIGTSQQMTFRLRTGDGQGEHAYRDRQPYFRTMPRLLIHETAVRYVDVFRFIVGERKPSMPICVGLTR